MYIMYIYIYNIHKGFKDISLYICIIHTMPNFQSQFINEIYYSKPVYRNVNYKKPIVVPQETLNTYFKTKFINIVKSFKLQTDIYDLTSSLSVRFYINKQMKDKFYNLFSKLKNKPKPIEDKFYIENYISSLKVIQLKKIIKNFKLLNEETERIKVPSLKKDLIIIVNNLNLSYDDIQNYLSDKPKKIIRCLICNSSTKTLSFFGSRADIYCNDCYI